ncbi:MAG: hypothetical protein K9H48_15735 [Melioribacteraceae bacterium]|nr:hypothetical protein [Saprospiraceae bacterium]MCF8355904.1 hypothetical protein [Melioribacteraceae bacterium]MCF8395444.1 hypothetical protein [Melioribacteraceae bacterium]
MKLRMFLLSLSLIIFSCSQNRIKVFNKVQVNRNNYSLYFINIGNDTSKQLQQKYDYPFYIDDQNVIKEMSDEWVLNVRNIPVEKKIIYKILLFDKDKLIQEVWLDSKYKTAIWGDELLFFSDTLLDKYKSYFKTLFTKSVIFENVNEARAFYQKLEYTNMPYYLTTSGYKYWLKYDGKYTLKRFSDELKPERNVGKIRRKITADFTNQEFELIDYNFNTTNDTIFIQISADSSYIDFIPPRYFIVENYKQYDSILTKIYYHKADSINKLINIKNIEKRLNKR